MKALLERYRAVPSFQPVLLGEGLTLDQVARFEVEQLAHPEFVVDVSHRRLYRLGVQAAHVLGYLGEARPEELADPRKGLKNGDWVGRRGVELEYDAKLRGEDGERVVVVDSHGQSVEELGREVGRPGGALTLTIDAELQQEAERQLEGQGRRGRGARSEERRDPRPGLLPRLRSRISSRGGSRSPSGSS